MGTTDPYIAQHVTAIERRERGDAMPRNSYRAAAERLGPQQVVLRQFFEDILDSTLPFPDRILTLRMCGAVKNKHNRLPHRPQRSAHGPT